MLFHIVENAVAILRSKGVYRQVPIYTRTNPTTYEAELFAKWGGGFIGLRAHGGTTVPHVMWEHVDGVEWQPVRFGALTMIVPQEVKRIGRA
jgi:hypothetical protein